MILRLVLLGMHGIMFANIRLLQSPKILSHFSVRLSFVQRVLFVYSFAFTIENLLNRSAFAHCSFRFQVFCLCIPIRNFEVKAKWQRNACARVEGNFHITSEYLNMKHKIWWLKPWNEFILVNCNFDKRILK